MKAEILANPLSVQAEWLEIFQLSNRATAFQSPDWVLGWLRHIVPDLKPWFVVVRDSGTIVGVVPLALVSGPGRLSRLLLLGGDYLDSVCIPGREEPFLDCFVDFLRHHRNKWDLMDLRSLHRNSVLSMLSKKTASPLRLFRIQHQSYPIIDLPTRWEDYVSSLSTSLRTELGYLHRRIDREFGDLRTWVSTPESLEEDRSRLERLHSLRWTARSQSGVLASEAAMRFHREAGDAMAARGESMLYNVAFDGGTRGSLLLLRKGGFSHYYIGGFDPAYGKFGPMKLVIGEAIKDSIARGDRYFDFLRGEEAYKSRWMATPVWTDRLVVTGNDPRALFCATGLSLQPWTKDIKAKLRVRF